MHPRTTLSGACAAVAALACGCNAWPYAPHHVASRRVPTFDSAFVAETVPLANGAAYLITGSGTWYVRDTIAQRVRPAETIADSLAASFGADFDLTPTVDGRAYAVSYRPRATWLLDGPIARRVHVKDSVVAATPLSAPGVNAEDALDRMAAPPALPTASFLFAQYALASERLRDCEDGDGASSESRTDEDPFYDDY
jgi:hypothetical protein